MKFQLSIQVPRKFILQSKIWNPKNWKIEISVISKTAKLKDTTQIEVISDKYGK